MKFKDRLKEYRLELGIKTKVEMAQKLGIVRTLYSMLENGSREPSRDVLEKLFLMSEKPEEYWLYGITDEKEYLNTREEFKCSKDSFNQLDEIGMLKEGWELSETVKEVILAAAIADYTHLLEKRKMKKD